MNLPNVPLRLSQGHLNVLSVCPRKFQYQYLDKIIYPIPIEQQDNLQWGNQFHLLMQQRELGLPVDHFLESDSLLKQCLDALVNTNPLLSQPLSAEAFRASEHQRTIPFNGYFITVIYDLVILDRQSGTIIDWKTYANPPRPDRLKTNWQTRLYPFVLVESTSYEPERISMSYWFVKSKKSLKITPESIEFQYNNKQHLSTETELRQILNQLTQWLEGYAEGIDLPQIPLSSPECDRCPFALRCDRHSADTASALSSLSLPSLDEIPERSI